MSLTFSCLPATIVNIQGTLSAPRLARYFGGAGDDLHHALQLYVWNARICEAFYLPTQICEVAARNAIHTALRDKHGVNWYQREAFLRTLPDRLKSELKSVIRTETTSYGQGMTVNHLVSGLSLGFWLHLLTSNYDGVFWPACFPVCFPRMPVGTERKEIYQKLDRFRIHRNRVAHHKPIFDRTPMAEYQNILDLLGWICTDTQWFVRSISRVPQTISARPPPTKLPS
jgi:hypothetical protein